MLSIYLWGTSIRSNLQRLQDLQMESPHNNGITTRMTEWCEKEKIGVDLKALGSCSCGMYASIASSVIEPASFNAFRCHSQTTKLISPTVDGNSLDRAIVQKPWNSIDY